MFEKYRNKLILFIVLIIIGCVFVVFYKNHHLKNKSDNNSRKSIDEFSNNITLTKKGNLLEKSDILIVADMDGIVDNLNIKEGDIVNEGQILMKIKNSSSDYINELQNDENILIDLQNQHENIQNHYDKINSDYTILINNLEQELLDIEDKLLLSVIQGNKEEKVKIEKNLEYLENQISSLQLIQQSINNSDNMKTIELENKIQFMRSEYNMYYNKMNDNFSKATIDGIISKILVENGDKIYEGDILCSIETNDINYISVDLDFDEYLLIQDISDVGLEFNILGNILSYSGVIFSRSPVINSNGKYSINIEVNYDEKLKKMIKENGIENIIVNFPIKSDGIWLPEACFSKIGNSTGIIIYKKGDILFQSNISIKSRQNGLILVHNLYEIIKSSIRILEGKSGLSFMKIEHNFTKNNKFIANDIGNNIINVEVLCM